MKKAAVFAVCFMLLIALVACSSSPEKYVDIDAQRVFATVRISPEYDWFNKSEDERLTLIEYAIDEVNKSNTTGDPNYRITGYYGKGSDIRLVFLYTEGELITNQTALDEINNEQKAEAEKALSEHSDTDNIQEISDGTAILYIITMPSSWNEMGFYEQGEAAQEAVQACKDKATNDGISKYSIQGKLSNGDVAFMYDGGKKIKLWINNTPADTWNWE